MRGFRGPKYRRFATWAEADSYVRQGQQTPEAIQAAQDTEHNPDPSWKMNLPGAPGLTSERPTDADGNEYPPGLGPLPPGAVDGFDPNVVLDPTTGKLKYRSPSDKVPTKQQPGRPGPLKIYTDGSSLRNGTMGAKAGVGVYFGPGDERYLTLVFYFIFQLQQSPLLHDPLTNISPSAPFPAGTCPSHLKVADKQTSGQN